MFKVVIKGDEAFFPSLRDAIAYAEKEAYLQAVEATVITPDGTSIAVKV